MDSLPAEPLGKPKNTGVGSLSLLQQIFPTQGLNLGLLHYRQILYHLSYQRSPITTVGLVNTLHYLWWFRWQRNCLQCGRPGFNPWVQSLGPRIPGMACFYIPHISGISLSLFDLYLLAYHCHVLSLLLPIHIKLNTSCFHVLAI